MPAWLTEASAVPPPLPCPAGPACFEVSLGNPPPPQVRGRPLQLPLPNLHCTLCLSRRPLFLGSPPPPHMLWRDDPGDCLRHWWCAQSKPADHDWLPVGTPGVLERYADHHQGSEAVSLGTAPGLGMFTKLLWGLPREASLLSSGLPSPCPGSEPFLREKTHLSLQSHL